jgi:hypothetical protein
MIVILFFIVFVILVYLFLSTRQTVVVYEEPTPVSWWPWGITSYNWWPYWSYGSSSGIVHHKRPHHGTHPIPHQESRPWGGTGRRANMSAPSSGGHSGSRGSHGGGPGGHGSGPGSHGGGPGSHGGGPGGHR